MDKQEMERMIENNRQQIVKTRADIEVQKSIALCLLRIARNEEEIRVQQEILLRLCESETKLNEVKEKLNRAEKWLSVL